MLNLSPATRVFVATQPVDLRGRFNRLLALTQTVLQQDPLSGHWFVFTNRTRHRVKILFWDGSGLWVLAKRLERGRFTWPPGENAAGTLRGEELTA
jgi:transposase